MAKFMLIYKGPATPMEEFTPEQSQETMQAWGEWIGKLGDAMLDPGAPFGASTSLKADGSTGAATDLTGYTIVEANDADAAAALCKDHPFLSDGRDVFSVEVFELVQMDM